MDRIFTLPFGDTHVSVRLPENNLAWVTGPQQAAPVEDVEQCVIEALHNPIGSPDLAELVRRCGKKTVILVDDGTRSTPQQAVLPVLLNELNQAGVPDTSITVLIGLGTHRAMRPDECMARYGQEIMQRVRVENLPQNCEDFIDLGVTKSGVPIQISRILLESELSIAVGTIIPHMYAGWSGGAKMVQPAASSALTTARTHLMAGPQVNNILGNVENPVRQEMEEVAARAGLKFILNFILNCSGEVVAAVAGDVVKAHRRGVALAEPIYTVTIDQPADIVIASSYPADRDLWQGFKPVNNCGMLVRDGGTLILLIPAPEGIAPDHPELLVLGEKQADEVLRMVAAGQVRDEVAAATHIAFDQTRRRIKVVLVTTGITPHDGAQIGLTVFSDLETALCETFNRYGNQARIGIVTHGADICWTRHQLH